MASAAVRLGSSTGTASKRRAMAASFSMCLAYSSRVVAPMTCTSPRARMGLRMLAASTPPSEAPAPMMECTSSRNRMALPACRTSARTSCRRCSKSPRYLVPATRLQISSESTLFPHRRAGARPSAMRSASPSTTAVLPTPASPTRQGAFFRRRRRMRSTAAISSSRQNTGSSLPSRASWVRSCP